MILHSHELYFTAEVTVISQKNGAMNWKISGRGIKEAPVRSSTVKIQVY